MSSRNPGGSAESSKKRRVDERGNNGGGDNDSTDYGNETPDLGDDESDGELSAGEIEKRKRKKAAFRKEATESRRRDKTFANVADAPDVPNAASQISKAIHEYVRMLMGMPRKSRSTAAGVPDPTLPVSPTETEMKEWLNRKEDREEVVKKAMVKAVKKYINSKPAGFKPNRSQIRAVEQDAAERVRSTIALQPVKFTSRIQFTTSSRYAHSWGTQCEAALALAGFGRCTFDWGAGYDTPWNSSMASIIISEWVKCFNSRGARAFGVVAKDNTQSNREELLRRWFTNKKTNYTQQKKDETLMQTEEGKKQVEANRTRAKKLVNRRRAKTNIYKARIGVTKAIFGEGSKEVKMLSQPEIHSEDDVNSEATCKIQLTWRSAELDTFISLTDQCIVGQEVVAAAHRAAQHLVDRGPYSTTPDFDVFPPKGFQRSLVSPIWLGNIPSVAVKNLKLTDDVVDIRQAIKRLTEELTKPSTPAT